MDAILNVLIHRLSEKDVLPLEVPRFIKDVRQIIESGFILAVQSMNRRLGNLGWGDQVLDEYIFALIIHLLETEGNCNVMASQNVDSLTVFPDSDSKFAVTGK